MSKPTAKTAEPILKDGGYMMWFCTRKCLRPDGISMTKNHFSGVKTPKKQILWDVNIYFKPNLLNFQMMITPKVKFSNQ